MVTVENLKNWFKSASSILDGVFSEGKITQAIYDQLKAKLDSINVLIGYAVHSEGSFEGAASLIDASSEANNFVSEAATAGITIPAI